MTSPRQKSPPPDVPEIETCPRCGNHILIGDRRCSKCGYNVTSLDEVIRDLPPRYVLIVGGAIGFILMLVAFSALEGTARAVMLFFALVFGGGGYLYFVVFNYILNDPTRRRRKLK